MVLKVLFVVLQETVAGESGGEEGQESENNTQSQQAKFKDVSHLKARLEKIKMMANS